MGDYNGWANHATWCVNLWLDNEEATYHDVREMARQINRHEIDVREATYDLAESLKDYVEELAETTCPGVIEGASFVSDLFGSALGDVDWNEIAGHLIEEVDE